MRAALFALCLLLAGCGSLGSLQGSATLQGGQLTGSLSVPVPGGNL